MSASLHGNRPVSGNVSVPVCPCTPGRAGNALACTRIVCTTSRTVWCIRLDVRPRCVSSMNRWPRSLPQPQAVQPSWSGEEYAQRQRRRPCKHRARVRPILGERCLRRTGVIRRHHATRGSHDRTRQASPVCQIADAHIRLAHQFVSDVPVQKRQRAGREHDPPSPHLGRGLRQKPLSATASNPLLFLDDRSPYPLVVCERGFDRSRRCELFTQDISASNGKRRTLTCQQRDCLASISHQGHTVTYPFRHDHLRYLVVVRLRAWRASIEGTWHDPAE